MTCMEFLLDSFPVGYDEPPPAAGCALELVILGEPASKANSRQIVMFGKRPAVIKSKKAREYVKAALPQVLVQCRRVGWRCIGVGPLRMTLRIFYASERPDLDESLVLDLLQQVVYGNDRQVREKHVYHAIDRTNPRAEIRVEPLQGGLDLAEERIDMEDALSGRETA